MQTAIEKVKADLHFTHFPLFAKFLLDNHLTDFVKEQMQLSKQMQLRLLRYFTSMSEDELVTLGKKNASDFLRYISENKAKEQIEESKQRWMKDQLPNFSRDQIIAEDILAVSYVRKQAFLKFIPLFMADMPQAMELLQEIDRYMLASETIFTETYIDLLHNSIDEHAQGLMQNEHLYKQAQELSHIGNWTWLVKEGKILWTDELYRIYGLDPQSQEITFELYASFVHPDDKEELFNTIQNALSSKMPYDLHHRIIAADGSVKHLNAKGSLQLDANGAPEKMLGTVQDITERTIIEHAARASQHFIQKTADATPAIIASYNINSGTYRFVSMGLKKLLGYDPKRPLEEGVQFFVNIIHPDDLPVIMEKNAAAQEHANNQQDIDAGESIVEFEYRMRHANGEYRWFHTYGTVFDRNGNGQVENVLNISIDTTERKEMETALTQKNLLLEQSNANLEEFAYVASHDLKEPLRKISIFGDRLLSTQHQYLGADGQLYLEKIIDSSRKMQGLINDLLSLSLITGNKSFVQYSLQDIINEVLRTLDHKIEEKKATVHAQPLPEARIIPSQFRQLFQNLLSNSLKFIKQDTKPEIFINFRWLRYKEVEQYKLIRSRSYLEITFTDNGIGFDNMFAGKIFAIFQRLNQKAYEGTGIGLAICKKIVENHGGVIFASGEPDNGATFTFIIPV